MKTISFFVLACTVVCLPLFSVAQNTDIQQLENEMRASSGPQRVEKLIALTDACLQAGQLEQAKSYAEEATDFARRIKRSDLQAVALNREGRVLVITGKKGFLGKEKAPGKFRESMQILRQTRTMNKYLALDNLQNLRQIAERAGRTGDVADIDNQIARINELAASLPSPPPAVPLEKSEKEDKIIQELTKLNENINAQLSAQKIPQKGRMEVERMFAALQAEKAAMQSQIDKMNEEQAKAALVQQQQKSFLDSLKNKASLDALKITNAELALRESKAQTNFFLAGLAAMLLLAGGATFSYFRARHNARVLAEKNKIIRAEQERSENLLLNILPALVADELKKQGRTTARFFDDVGVLFADFVGFSKIAEKLTPQELVTELDTCFQAFDDIIAKYNLEKIKTIGDAYMVAGGLPNGGGSRLQEMIQAAKEMQSWLARWNEERRKKGLPVFEARIGIHRGSVVAGVVGSKKFAFDIWGDAVNVAARIEAAGEGGKINISGDVYESIKPYFNCQYRGKIAAKNKGEIDMYFVEN